MSSLQVTLEFSGGAELLAGKQKKHNITLPATDSKVKTWTIGSLIPYIVANILTQKEELFVQNGTVRPGILVLVNDTDWELLNTLDYLIQPNDRITFISTLHGG